MKKGKNKVPMTTICVDVPIRNRISEEAERLGISQRQMVDRLVETYDLSLIRDMKENSPAVDAQSLVEMLEKVLKRDDRIIAFIKTQESELLKPILAYINRIEVEIRVLNNQLKTLQ